MNIPRYRNKISGHKVISCDTVKNPAAVALGRLGGKAGTGAAKARSSEQMRAAALASWVSRRKRKVNG